MQNIQKFSRCFLESFLDKFRYIGKPCFYCTTPCKDRLSMLRVLLGGADPRFRLNARALALLEQLKVSPKWSALLKKRV
jgi:hypothetical protein